MADIQVQVVRRSGGKLLPGLGLVACALSSIYVTILVASIACGENQSGAPLVALLLGASPMLVNLGYMTLHLRLLFRPDSQRAGLILLLAIALYYTLLGIMWCTGCGEDAGTIILTNTLLAVGIPQALLIVLVLVRSLFMRLA